MQNSIVRNGLDVAQNRRKNRIIRGMHFSFLRNCFFFVIFLPLWCNSFSESKRSFLRITRLPRVFPCAKGGHQFCQMFIAR